MKKVLIWGTGAIAKQVLSNGICGELLGFIQSEKSMDMYDGKSVYGLDELPKEYDFIIAANSFSDEIYHTCCRKKLPLEKVLFLRGIKSREGLKDLTVIREVLGEKNFTNYCAEFGLKEESFFEY